MKNQETTKKESKEKMYIRVAIAVLVIVCLFCEKISRDISDCYGPLESETVHYAGYEKQGKQYLLTLTSGEEIHVPETNAEFRESHILAGCADMQYYRLAKRYDSKPLLKKIFKRASTLDIGYKVVKKCIIYTDKMVE